MARPVGSTTKPQFRDFVHRLKDGSERMEKLLDKTLKDAETNPDLAKWCLDQYFGKAPQAVEMTGKDGKDLIPQESSPDIQKVIEQFEQTLRETITKK